jgi:hypothetical protein
MRAVKAGYNFNLFPEENLSGIDLEPTGGKVEVGGVVYPLYRGATYAESEKVDRLLDAYGEMPIRDYKVKSREQER